MVGLVSGNSDQLEVLRAIVGLAVLIKFIADHYCGMWHYFDVDQKSLVRYRYERRDAAVVILLKPSVFRFFYVARAVGGGLLFLGVLPGPAALVVAAWCFFEFTWDRKFNTLFLGFLSAILATAPGRAQYLSLEVALTAPGLSEFLAPSSPDPALTWQQVAVAVFVTLVYWSSAWHKLRSRQFRSGNVLQKSFERMATIDRELPRSRREYFMPAFFTRTLAIGDPGVVARRWRPASYATIALELALPIMLLIPSAWLAAVAVGGVMHLAFTAIVPKRLVPFGLAALGSYLMFLPPSTFHHAQEAASRWVT